MLRQRNPLGTGFAACHLAPHLGAVPSTSPQVPALRAVAAVLTVGLGPLQVPGRGLVPARGADGVRQRSPLREVAAELQRLAAPRDLQGAHVCGGTRGTGGSVEDTPIPWGPRCSPLTLGHLVQQHRDLLIVQQPALEEADEDTVGELALAQLVGFGVCAPAGMGQGWAPSVGPLQPPLSPGEAQPQRCGQILDV